VDIQMFKMAIQQPAATVEEVALMRKSITKDPEKLVNYDDFVPSRIAAAP